MNGAHRYAVYAAPTPDSDWWEAGSRWLGRCAARQIDYPQPGIEGVAPAVQQALTAAPRRYGWHATLRAPFAPAPGVDLPALRTALTGLARTLLPVPMPALKVTRLDGFLALVPMGDTGSLDAIAHACVRTLHPLAAPLDEAELRRRRGDGLTPDQEAMLQRWGYPFVMDEFRLHFSLTGALKDTPAPVVDAIASAATRWFAPLPALRLDTLALFAEPAPGAPFVLVDHVALGR